MANTTMPAPHPLDVKDPPKKPEMIFACIEDRRRITLCNRSPADNEFLFTSVRHAVAHYNPRAPKTPTPTLRACIVCYDAAKEKIAKEDESRLA